MPRERQVTTYTTFFAESPHNQCIEAFCRGFVAGVVYNLSGAADEPLLQGLLLLRKLAWTALASTAFLIAPVVVTPDMDKKVFAMVGLVLGSMVGLLLLEVKDLMAPAASSLPSLSI